MVTIYTYFKFGPRCGLNNPINRRTIWDLDHLASGPFGTHLGPGPPTCEKVSKSLKDVGAEGPAYRTHCCDRAAELADYDCQDLGLRIP